MGFARAAPPAPWRSVAASELAALDDLHLGLQAALLRMARHELPPLVFFEDLGEEDDAVVVLRNLNAFLVEFPDRLLRLIDRGEGDEAFSSANVDGLYAVALEVPEHLDEAMRQSARANYAFDRGNDWLMANFVLLLVDVESEGQRRPAFGARRGGFLLILVDELCELSELLGLETVVLIRLDLGAFQLASCDLSHSVRH